MKHELKFEKLEFENYGVFLGEHSHDFKGRGITQVIGINEWFEPGNEESRSGAGKSFFCHGILYALYGETLRQVSKDKVINKQAKKNCRVALTFSAGSNRYRVERYRKHHKFKNAVFLFQFIDGEWKDISYADTSQVEAQILDIIRIEKDLFVISHLLAQDGSTLFFELNSNERMGIFEKLISGMGFDKKLKALKKEQTILNKKQAESETKVASKEAELNTMRKLFRNDWYEQRNATAEAKKNIIALDEKIKGFGVDIVAVEDYKQFLIEKIENVKQKKGFEIAIDSGLSLLKSSLRNRKNMCFTLKKLNISLLTEDSKCPHCDGVLDSNEDVRQHAVKEIANIKKDYTDERATIRRQIRDLKELQENFKAMPELRQEPQVSLTPDLKTEIVESIKNKTKINSIEKAKELEEEKNRIIIPTLNYLSNKKKIAEMRIVESTLKEFKEILAKDVRKVEINSYWTQAYTNKIKLFAIGKLIPHFNKLFSDILTIVFKGKIEIILNNETLEETCVYNGIEHDYYEFSTGERKRINICFYLAILLLVRINIITSNVMHLDELFSSVDPLAIRFIVKILQNNFPDSLIYLVSHENKIEEILEENPKIIIRKTGEFTAQLEV